MAATGTAPAEGGRHTIFAVLFALYLVAHHFYLYGGGLEPAKVLAGALFLPGALLLLAWPRSLALFLFNAVLHLAQTVWLMPIFSNHVMISLFLTVGLVWGYLHAAFRARRVQVPAEAYYDTYAPLGRCLLVVMYLYGTLHKVNSDFLDPAVSCAVMMWRRYGWPEAIADSGVIHALAIYGTLAVESAAIVMLLTRRFRFWGILLGIAFHGFLGFVPPGSIQAYSLLAIMLHGLFLPPETHARFRGNPLVEALRPYLSRPLARTGTVLAGAAVWALLPREPAWIVLVGSIVAFVIAYGREHAASARAEPAGTGHLLISPSWGLNALAILFLLNGLSPYVGFKSAQTITMFSNLTTEQGRTNHVFLPSVPVFGYQSRVARVIETDHPVLGRWQRQGYRMVEFQVLDFLERGGHSARFEVVGRVYAHTPEAPLPAVEDLPPRWVRNLMMFRPVDPGMPRRCDSY